MPSDLVVYGAGGMGQEVVDLVAAAHDAGGAWRAIGFLDANLDLHGHDILGTPVLGGPEWLAGRRVAVCVAVGAPAARRRVAEAVEGSGAVLTPALVHPAAYVGKGSRLGRGTIVAAGAVLTADVEVGACGIVNAGATVSHNARLGDFATVAPGAHLAGNVRLGEGADFGIGASIIQGLRVGEWSVVGAGAVVIADVAANTTVVGCPARVVASRQPGWHL